MKKSLSLLLLVCILCLSVILPGLADPETTASAGNAGQDKSATSGVDVVIVLDTSNSMRITDSNNRVTGGSDPDNYRLDATAMLIGMLDMNTSRVAVLPFNKTVIEYDDLMHLMPVDNTMTRKNLIERVYQVGAILAGETDYGSALEKAIEILLKEKDTSGKYKDNQPMIVLMTDGYNSMNSESDTQRAHNATSQAVQQAKENEIPIYTVVLDANKSKSDTGGMTMEQISIESGAGKDGSQGTQSDVNKLPSFFAKVLAERIGSSTTFKATEDIEINGDLYRIKLPLVNNSIKEANIIIPIKIRTTGKKIERSEIISSIKIYKGDQVVEPYYQYDAKGHFAIIKIKDIEGGDDWVLEYKNGANPGADISLLYNYDIKLDAQYEIKNNMTNRTTVFKDDVLSVEALFVDLNGKPSADKELYKKHTEDDSWGTIKAFYTIRDADGDLITDGENGVRMETAESGDRFTGEINLAEYHKAGKLKAGTYTIEVLTEGAGLKRSVQLDFTVENRAPEPTEAAKNNTYTYPNDIAVNLQNEDQQEGASWGVVDSFLGAETEGSAAVLAKDLVADADGEELSFNLSQTSGQDILKLEKAIDENGNVVIRFTTVQEDDQRKNKSGTATAKLTADDGDGGTCDVDITVNVDSKNDIFWDTYDIQVVTDSPDTADDFQDQDQFKKHQDITIWVYLVQKDDGKTVAPRVTIDQVTQQELLSITQPRKNSDVIDPVEYTIEEEDENYPGRYRYTVNTGKNETEWTMTMTFKGHEPYEVELKKIKVLNENAPAVKDDVPTGDLTLNCGGGWALSFLGGLVGDDTPNQDIITGETFEDKNGNQYVTIDPKTVFADEDGDELAISAPKFYEPGTDNEIPEDKIRVKQVGGHYEISFSGDSTGIWHPDYDTEMRITATDEDGLEETYTRRVKVQHLHNLFFGWVMIAAIVIVVLVILFLIIHQIRKPRFPMLNMTIREEPSLFASASETLSPVKTPTNVNAMGVDGDMAARHNVSMELLQNVIVKPIRSSAAVGVCYKKMMGGHEVTLEDVKLKPKKQYTWKLEQELIIRNMNGEGMIAIKLEDRSRDNESDDVMNAFGGNDGWTDSDPGMTNVTYSDGKHSRKVKKKASQAEEDNSFNSGKDDFDF